MGNAALGQQLGLRIKELRTERKWSQKTLAEKLHINKSVISYYELGERYPSYDVLINIASIFHVTLDYLLLGESHKQLDVSGLSNEEYLAVATIVASLKTKKGL